MSDNSYLCAGPEFDCPTPGRIMKGRLVIVVTPIFFDMGQVPRMSSENVKTADESANAGQTSAIPEK